MFENKCMIVMMMACVVVIVVQKRFEFEFSKTLGPAFFFEKFKKSSGVVVVIGGFGGWNQ